jgi:hypothetical protein
LFFNPEDTTPTETITNSVSGGTYSSLQIGANHVSGAPGPWYFDDLAVSEVDWIGPTAGPPSPPRNIHLSNAALQPAFTR